MKTVGVLALQGDFAAHEAALIRVGANPIQVRTLGHFDEIEGLIIPGGESTTMLKLLHYDGLMDRLRRFAAEKCIFGTCAGAILLAKSLVNSNQETLGAMDIRVERNAYGRQRDSRITAIQPEKEFLNRAGPGSMEVVFIRAPIIRDAAPNATVLARYNGDPILVEQGRHMAGTFHPELTADNRVHALFLQKL
ncbi:MAG: pyridoxal 5'-phosphate synthase glutaminase subunit PdxT [Pseudomonadota bacterium]|nr:pyridoxal 5'-phosphate synthase glutaminase subunit PdxT [Pseudomonadota bacterium]